MIILGQLIDFGQLLLVLAVSCLFNGIDVKRCSPEGAALISINITLHLQKKKKGRTEKA